MGTLTLRNIDDSLKENLRMRAAANGRSMEEEARQILRQGLLQGRCAEGIGTRIARRFSSADGVDLPDPERSTPRRPPNMFKDDAA